MNQEDRNQLADDIDALIRANKHKSEKEKLHIYAEFIYYKLKADTTLIPDFLRALADWMESKPLTTKALAGLLELILPPVKKPNDTK